MVDFLFDEPIDLDEYVKRKLDEAADWRKKQWAELEARKQRVQDLNNVLIDLRDQAKGR